MIFSSAKTVQMLTSLSPLEISLVLLGFSLLTITTIWTILDYTNKGKHIDRKKW
jgi:hypothetical protein